jgi:hypothetical protein
MLGQNVLSEKSLYRFFRAWCPFCYEEQRESDVVYDCLFWTLSTVDICPIHKRTLYGTFILRFFLEAAGV